MSRTISAVENQTVYDLAIQYFGNLNSIDKVMRQIGGMNYPADFGQVFTFDGTENNLVKRFEANKAVFATYADE